MAYTTINKGSSYFNTKLYTGTGSSLAITGVGFQPDWVWIKDRSSAQSHWVVDVIRGADQRLQTNTTSADSTQVTGVTSFDTDGFTVGTDNSTNGSGLNFVSWCWDANGAGVSNTAGTISSTISANTTAGFSIVSYTGTGATATVGHGLGVAPSFIIFKTRNATYNWIVWTKAFATPTSQYLRLNLTDAVASGNNPLNGTLPSSTVISLSSDNNVNESAKTYIAYCFAEVKGYSKFGSYTGNGSADGTFIYTGFKPAFVLVKNTTTAGTNWQIVDNKRVGYNGANHRLYPDDSAAESTTQTLDILSNGFKAITTNNLVNASSATYIYMAFAENPFVSSTFIPTTAR